MHRLLVRRIVLVLVLVLGFCLASPGAQGQFWVLVNGALNYTGPVNVTGSPLTTTLDGIVTGPQTAPSGSIIIQNTTPATSGVPQQYSPGLVFAGTAYDVDDAVSRTTHCYLTLRPINAAVTVTSQLQVMCENSPFTGTYTQVFALKDNGQLTTPGSIVAGVSSTLQFNGRALMRSTADGLMQFVQNSGITVGAELNVGTAAPTVTSCGTGAVTAHSNNTFGEITPTGATACTVTFGAPAWTFQPFCTVTMEGTAEVVRISAISTTAFTVNFATSGNKFMYHCGGGAI